MCQATSDIQQNTGGILHAVLDALQEQYGVLTVQQAMVVGQGQVHHRAGYDLVATDYWAVDNGVHTQNGRLGRVDDWSSHQRAKSTTVGNGEGAAIDIFKGEFAVLALFGEFCELLHNPISTSSIS